MTSNQLAYWKLEEEKRSNKAKEAETNRSNVANEDIRRVSNALEDKGLQIKDKQLLTQLAELYVTQGATSWAQLPDELQKQLEDAYQTGGLSADDRSATFSDVVAGLYKELKDIFKGGGAKIISALF